MIEAKLPTENAGVGRQGILDCHVHPSHGARLYVLVVLHL